jgi:hypothetical protein
MYVMKLDASFKPLNFTNYILLEPSDQKRVDIAINRIANVIVRVLNQNGEPIENALVTLPSVTYMNGQRTLREPSGIVHNYDGDGIYRLTGVPSGEYYLRIEHATPPVNSSREAPPRDAYYPGVADFAAANQVIVRGGDLRLDDVRLPLQHVFKISGTIVDPLQSAPTSSATGPGISIYAESVDRASSRGALQSGVRFGTTSDPHEVSFEMGGFSPGTYVLYPLRLPLADARTVYSRMVVTIGDKDVEGLRMVLGRLVGAEARFTANGLPVKPPASLRFELRQRDFVPIRLQTSLAFVPDFQSGRLDILNMVDGVRYGINVSGLSPDTYVADVRTEGRSILYEGSFVAHASQQPIEIQLGAPSGAIQGVVLNAMSQPVPKAEVVIIPDFAKRQSSFLYKRATADSVGRFSVRGLAPGDYQLFAWPSPPPQGAEEDPAFLAPFENRGATVRSTPGVTTEATLRVTQ